MGSSGPTPGPPPGPRRSPEARWILIFRLLSFLLGAAVIIDALVVRASVIQWVTGLVLVGIVPPEAIAYAWRR